MNYSLNNKLFDKIIESEINSAVSNISESSKELLKLELRKKLNTYKSYTTNSRTFWTKYKIYLQSKEWKSFRQTVFKRDGGKCLLCGAVANHCHHISYGHFVKYGDSKRLECASLCQKCHEDIHGKKIGK
jgi:5-methylcytosine-specific restriction endonuclease McrA